MGRSLAIEFVRHAFVVITATGLAAMTHVFVSTGQAAVDTTAAQAPTFTSTNPFAATYDVRRFALVDDTILSQVEIDDLTRQALGSHVPLSAIRQALVRLQTAYRERGFTHAALTLPRQAITNGVVLVRVSEQSQRKAPLLNFEQKVPEGVLPGYNIQHFEIRGNSVLTAEEIDQILGLLAGPRVTVEQIRQRLDQLRKAYQDHGFVLAVVSLPEQVLTDGNVYVQVREGFRSGNADAPRALDTQAAAVPSRAPASRTFTVRRYDMEGNTRIKPEVVTRILTNAVGSAVTLQQIQSALGELQLAYRERGFATVAVGLPQQRLTNGVVKVLVTEGRLANVHVTGNRFFSSNNVARALPSLTTNAPLNSRILQRELDLANQNPDRLIYPAIEPGPDPGTSDLNLRIKDRLPLHGRLELNNQSTPGTPDWRLNASLQYANLWQLEHQLGISYGFTPDAYKAGALTRDYYLNRPLVANYAAYYRLPFGSATSTQKQITGSSGQFGYDEATHQFRLPTAGARPDLTFYASASSSDTGVKLGPAMIVSQTPLLTIVSQDSGQNLSFSEGAGGRLSIPVVLDDNHHLSFAGGLEAKRYALDSYNTNNFIINTVVTNSQGAQTIENRVASPQPSRHSGITYLPITLSGDYVENDPDGTLAANLSLSGNFLGTDGDFAAVAYSRRSKAIYGKATLSVTRDQILFKRWSLLIRAAGQGATGPLVSNEQLALGGVNSVRGYFEGDEYGDNGWFGSLEVRTPYLASEVPFGPSYLPVWLRASAFVDAGQRFAMDTTPGSDPFQTLLGAGFGLSGNINNHLDARITVAWPFRNSANTRAYDPRLNFSLGGQF